MVVTVPTTEVITDFGKVDEHLADLYRRTMGADVPGAPVTVIRALLSNLIVYARTEAEADEAAVNVSEIAGSHPCRAIIVRMQQPRPDESPAIVSAVCGITQRGDRRLCGEIITLHVEPGNNEIPGLVNPLLLADVPVFVWVPGDVPVADEDFEALVPMASHVILDSRRFEDLRTGLGLTSRFCPHEGVECTMSDLSWMSLQPWRELMAQHFDSPSQRQYLAGLERVDVSFARPEREEIPPSPALLLASWFMERTGVMAESAEHLGSGAFVVRARQDDRPVEVHLSPTGRGIPPGRVGAIVARGIHAGQRATFIVKSVSMTGLVVTEECPGVCLVPQVLDLPPQAEPQLAAQAMDAHHHDVVYEAAVGVAGRVLDLLGSSDK